MIIHLQKKGPKSAYKSEKGFISCQERVFDDFRSPVYSQKKMYHYTENTTRWSEFFPTRPYRLVPTSPSNSSMGNIRKAVHI